MTNPDMDVDDERVNNEEEMKEEEDEEDDGGDSSSDEGEDDVYIPGGGELENGQTLEVDENAYIVYHQCSLGPPCLSFDIIHDQVKEDYPLSVTCVAGTQAAKVTANNIIVFRMSNLHCVRPVDEDEDSDVDEPPEEKP